MTDDTQLRTLISAARDTARGMAEAVAGRGDDCTVTVKGGQFRFIATMLEKLADATRASTCDCMGKPIDGIRFWVPQERFVLERERADRLANELVELRESIRFSGELIAY